MKTEPQVAQFLWIGGALSTLERLSLRSFLDHGYAVHLYTYDEVGGVPSGVRLMNGEEVLPRSRIFSGKKGFGEGGFAGFSDLFRYHLLHQRGGWWFDLDFVSIRALPVPTDLWIATSFEGQWGPCANGCALYAPRGHPVLAKLCAEADHALNTGDIFFGQIGPYLVQRLVRDLDLQAHLAPWWEFCPYPHQQIFLTAYQSHRACVVSELRRAKYWVRQTFNADFRAGYLRSGTRAVHLHNELWRAAGRDKNADYHSFSLYERLKRRHPLSP